MALCFGHMGSQEGTTIDILQEIHGGHLGQILSQGTILAFEARQNPRGRRNLGLFQMEQGQKGTFCLQRELSQNDNLSFANLTNQQAKLFFLRGKQQEQHVGTLECHAPKLDNQKVDHICSLFEPSLKQIWARGVGPLCLLVGMHRKPVRSPYLSRLRGAMHGAKIPPKQRKSVTPPVSPNGLTKA